MLEKNDLKLLDSMLRKEQDIIATYNRYISCIKDPQTQIDMQKIISQHKNQYTMLLRLLEE